MAGINCQSTILSLPSHYKKMPGETIRIEPAASFWTAASIPSHERPNTATEPARLSLDNFYFCLLPYIRNVV